MFITLHIIKVKYFVVFRRIISKFLNFFFLFKHTFTISGYHKRGVKTNKIYT